MKDAFERVKKEYYELKERILKLSEFLTEEEHYDQLLYAQLHIMEAYANILDIRMKKMYEALKEGDQTV